MLRLPWLVLLVPTAAAADDAWHVVPSATVGIEHFHYAELDSATNAIYDEHLGFVPTARLAVEATSPRSHLFVRGSLRLTSGSVEYYGGIEDFDTGAITPDHGPADGHMIDADLVVGGRGHIGDHAMLGGFVGAGHHSWERDLRQLPAGYLEDYTWSYLQIGVQADAAVAPRVSLSLQAAVLLLLGENFLEDLRNKRTASTTRTSASGRAWARACGSRARTR